MKQKNDEIKSKILEAALPDIAFDGWSADLLQNATKKAGYGSDMARAVFPEGVRDFVDYFSEWADQRMLQALEHVDTTTLGMTDKVTMAVERRLEILQPHKEAVRQASKYWSLPPRSIYAKRAMWQTADKIWTWAGDTATDYNKYTKRALLMGVIGSTFFYWLNKPESDLVMVKSFLHRRIQNVLVLGKGIGKFKSLAPEDIKGRLSSVIHGVKTIFSVRA